MGQAAVPQQVALSHTGQETDHVHIRRISANRACQNDKGRKGIRRKERTDCEGGDGMERIELILIRKNRRREVR
jgi:hypothetical protein